MGSGRRTLEGALDHGAGERPAIAGAGVDVILRVDRHGRYLGRARHSRLVDGAPIDHSFDVGQTTRPVPYSDDSDMGVDSLADGVSIMEQGGTGDREVSTTARELFETPAAVRRPGRQPDLGDDL